MQIEYKKYWVNAKNSYKLVILLIGVMIALSIPQQGQNMADFIRAIKELIGELGNVGPTGIAVLALLVALSAILVLGEKI